MQRRDFRSWGRELDDDGFAAALAAAGVLAAAGLLPPTLYPAGGPQEALQRLLQTRDPIPWHAPNVDRLPPAAELRKQWDTARGAGPVRLEIREWGPGSPAWLAQQLARPGLGVRGVYVRVDHPAVDVAWEWPLWIGVLGDQRSSRLRIRLEELIHGQGPHWWMRTLVTVVDLSHESTDCDLLILPHDLRGAVAAAAATPFTIRADCTLVLGRAPEGDARLMSQLAGLRGVVRTSGVVLAHIPGRRRASDPDVQMQWLQDVLREMTHNSALDVALAAATEDAGLRMSRPLLVGSRKLVEFSRLAVQVRRMAARFKSMAVREDSDVAMAVDSAYRETFGTAGAEPRSRVADRLADAAAVERYPSERGVASVAAELSASSLELPTRRVESRYLQARVYDVLDAPRIVERKRALRPLAPHEIRVRIAPPDPQWLASAEVFPIEELPPDQPEYQLTIVLSDTSYRSEPQVDTIVLPAVGASGEASFYVQAGDAGKPMEWRIAVAYGNRVLQTALLQAPVAGADQGDPGIHVVREAMVRPTFEDLHERTRFDAALVLNHSPTGEAGVLVMEEEGARSFPVSSAMEAVLKWFDKNLTDVALNRSTYEGGLQTPESLDLLRLFAQQGAQLYGHIVTDGIGDGGLARGPRLHVVSATADARLPLEFVYDRIGPRDDATLCPTGLAALSAPLGALEAAPNLAPCQHPADEASVVCPRAFWGVQKVIERHRHDRELRLLTGRDAFLLRAEPARDRKPLAILRAGIVGGNYRVDAAVPDGMASVGRRLTEATKLETIPLTTWDAWTKAVEAMKPSILIAIVHNERKQNTLFTRMEIGRDSWIDVNAFNQTHFRTDKDGPAPVLLLISCESAAADVNFNSFVAKARQLGAAMVVAAGAKIHAAHAVMFASALIDTLHAEITAAAVSGNEITFGDIFLRVRRSLLAQGVLMVLTLETYGDADWRLESTH